MKTFKFIQEEEGGGWEFFASNGESNLRIYTGCAPKDWPMIKKEMKATFGKCKFLVIRVWKMIPEIVPDDEILHTNITMKDV